MMLAREKRKKIVAAVAVTIFASVFFFEGNQRQSHAEVNPDLGNLGSEITCFVYSQLNELGSPIPVLNAGDCQNPPGEPPNPPPSPPPSPPPNDGETDPPPSGGGDNGSPLTPPADSTSSPQADSGQADTESSRGGRSGGSSRPAVVLPSGEVLGVETCDEYLFEYIKFGRPNNPLEVLKLQRFLKDIAGFVNLKETNVYDEATLAAVHEFQKMHATAILAPWGATRSTGHVYYTTKKAINEIHCKFLRQFPLSSEQEAEIAHMKAFGESINMPIAPTNIEPLVPEVFSQSAAVGASASSTPLREWIRGLMNWLRIR